jgi:hypothetical protein
LRDRHYYIENQRHAAEMPLARQVKRRQPGTLAWAARLRQYLSFATKFAAENCQAAIGVPAAVA